MGSRARRPYSGGGTSWAQHEGGEAARAGQTSSEREKERVSPFVGSDGKDGSDPREMGKKINEVPRCKKAATRRGSIAGAGKIESAAGGWPGRPRPGLATDVSLAVWVGRQDN